MVFKCTTLAPPKRLSSPTLDNITVGKQVTVTFYRAGFSGDPFNASDSPSLAASAARLGLIQKQDSDSTR